MSSVWSKSTSLWPEDIEIVLGVHNLLALLYYIIPQNPLFVWTTICSMCIFLTGCYLIALHRREGQYTQTHRRILSRFGPNWYEITKQEWREVKRRYLAKSIGVEHEQWMEWRETVLGPLLQRSSSCRCSLNGAFWACYCTNLLFNQSKVRWACATMLGIKTNYQTKR